MFKVDANTVSFVEAADESGTCFNSPGQLLALADRLEWSREKLEDIWNNFAGAESFAELKPVKKFRNRPFACQRIWDEIQRLRPTGEDSPVKELALPKTAKKPKVAKEHANGFRPTSKAAEALRMIQRERGASVSELMEKFGWQAHSVRGFVSTLQSKHGISVTTEKSATRGLVYQAA